MTSSVGFHIPFLHNARKSRNCRNKDTSSLLEASSIDGTDHSVLYPESNPPPSPARSLDWHLQNRYEGNPLLNESIDSLSDGRYAQQMCLYPSSASLCSETTTHTEATLWSCQYCNSAFFRTEHETMLHELTCLENAKGPLIEKDETSSTGTSQKNSKGRRLARILMQRSGTSRRRCNGHGMARKDINKIRRHRERISTGELSDKCAKTKGIKNRMKNIVFGKSKDSSSKEFRNSSSKGGRLSGRTISIANDDTTISTAESYDMTRLSVPVESDNPFHEKRHLVSTGPRSNCTSPSNSPTSAVVDVETKCKSPQQISSRTVDLDLPPSLRRRPSTEELLDKLGLSDQQAEKVRAAVEIIRNRSFSDDSSSNSRSTYSSWGEEELAGIMIPNYDEFIGMAVTGFRRDVLGIDDAFYTHLQSISTNLFPKQITLK